MRNRSFRVSARRTSAWLHGAVALTSLIAFGGCSAPPEPLLADDEGADVPEYGGPSQGAPGVSMPAQPGNGAPPGAPGSTGATGSNTNGNVPPAAPSTNGNEQNGANGAPLTPNNNTGNSSGANQGAAGSSMVPPPNSNPNNSGAGGASMGGNDNGGTDDGAADPTEPPTDEQDPPPVTPPPVTPPPVTPPPVTPPPVQPPAGPDIACPAGAAFCSGFESDTLPNGAIYQGNPALEFDDTVSHSGDRSVVFDAVDGFNIREVVTPIPGQAFWVRLFIQTSTTYGDNDHDSLFVASTATLQQDNNAEHGPEFSEQGNQILINADDQLFNAAGPGFPSNGQGGPQLTPNVWHCVEAFYDGASGNVQFFSDGQQIISAPGFARLTYATFRFGYLQFPGHTPHVVWYDDVVVAGSRVGCN